MSLILGIDTSSVDMGIGLYQNGEPVASYSRFVKNSHAEHIAQAVEMQLNLNSLQPKDISHIAVSVGPGSFTGLRIGIAFMKGFCFSRLTPVLPVSSLEVLAYSAFIFRGRIVAAIDARNDDVFYAIFKNQSGKIIRESEDILVNSEVFRKIINPDDIIITDTMGYIKSSVFNSLSEHDGWRPVEKHPVQRGLYTSMIGKICLENSSLWRNEMEIKPNYLRSSAAQKPKV
jgi:tRNA threonylcarbamoyladenosine biosynthesis protein TsaB